MSTEPSRRQKKQQQSQWESSCDRHFCFFFASLLTPHLIHFEQLSSIWTAVMNLENAVPKIGNRTTLHTSYSSSMCAMRIYCCLAFFLSSLSTTYVDYACYFYVNRSATETIQTFRTLLLAFIMYVFTHSAIVWVNLYMYAHRSGNSA